MIPIVYHPEYVCKLPDGHRFPMEKFRMIAEALRKSDGLSEEREYRPEPVATEQLNRVHDAEYVDRFLNGRLSSKEQRRIGLPWSRQLVKRTRRAVGGTIRTMELALEHGMAGNTAGGTHHAKPESGAGFCILNDLAVAAVVAKIRHGLDSICILDCDVHQGDGTAEIFLNDDAVYTVSIHTEENYPFEKKNSDLDVTVPKGAGDREYLESLGGTLEQLEPLEQFELVLYDAGVDVHREDLLGHLDVTDDGLYERDRRVLGSFHDAGVPVAGVVGGGYARDLGSLTRRHVILHRCMNELAGEAKPAETADQGVQLN